MDLASENSRWMRLGEIPGVKEVISFFKFVFSLLALLFTLQVKAVTSDEDALLYRGTAGSRSSLGAFLVRSFTEKLTVVAGVREGVLYSAQDDLISLLCFVLIKVIFSVPALPTSMLRRLALVVGPSPYWGT